MKLLVLMFHRARVGRHGNSPELLAQHFAYVADACANVLPGERLSPERLNVCLSFDDAYFDFYACVFPLLVRFNLRALLAVPPMFVQERSAADRASRLGVSAERAFDDPALGGFCTWPELAEMAASGHVAVAAHGFSHQSLDAESANLDVEIDSPHTILRTRLGRPVDSFVFPYGRYSRRALQRAHRRYRHNFRIGGALNHDWDGRVMYRVDADEMVDAQSLFAPGRLNAYRARYYWNRLRGR